ncbi:MAG: hypothetical protein K9J06_05115 [Flavobacteriales bacterium]|nr:hypothetical protein [Flavobacteriales bacterium]
MKERKDCTGLFQSARSYQAILFTVHFLFSELPRAQRGRRHYLGPMRPISLVLLLLLPFWGTAQGLHLEARMDGKWDAMTTDHLGHVYLTRGGEIFLYGHDGRLLYQFSDLSYGRIGSIDTRNPMKVLVFYPDFSRIMFLDNTLSKNREQSLRLDRINLSLVQLVCASFDNGFWAYDPVYFRMLRFDQQMNVTNSIENVNQLVGSEIDPTHMMEEGDWLYLNDPKRGIFRFDIFGTYSKLIPTVGITEMQVRNDAVLYTRGNSFFRYDPLPMEEAEIALPSENFRSVRLEKERFYMLDSTGVSIYRYIGNE